MSAIPRMEPGQVVEASLADLADNVVVSVPGLGDTDSLAGSRAGARRQTRPAGSSARRVRNSPQRLMSD
jgi:hypothetical protein